jgi:hypothetical protein
VIRVSVSKKSDDVEGGKHNEPTTHNNGAIRVIRVSVKSDVAKRLI